MRQSVVMVSVGFLVVQYDRERGGGEEVGTSRDKEEESRDA